MRNDRLFSRMALFWNAIMAALILLSSVQVISDRPGVLHSWDGLATAALACGYGAWFLFLMTIRADRRREEMPSPRPIRPYVLLTVGVALTVALVLLHGEYVGLIFADMGMAVFVLDGAVSLIPVTLLGVLFLYATGDFHATSLSRFGEDMLSLVATAGIVYTLAVVVRQRVERDKLIAELESAHREMRLASAREVELAALRERNRLAREMHDSLGHALVLIGVKIEAAQRLQAVDPERATAEWEATKALVRSTMADLRTSLAGLRRPVLDDQSFLSALADLAGNLTNTGGVEIDMRVTDEIASLDQGLQEILYRVAQEALANVARHARADHAWLSLEVAGDIARLLVEDDGIGLDASRRPGEHFGVVGMRERVEAVGGSLVLRPRSGGGVLLRAEIPVSEGADVRHPHLVG